MKDYYKYCLLPENKSGNVIVSGYGYETFERRKLFSPLHVIKHNSVHFVTKGEGTLYIEDKSYPLKKGAMFLCPPNKRLCYHTSLENPYTYYWINFIGDNASDVLRVFNLSAENPVVYPEQFEKVKQAFYELVSSSQTANEYLALSTLYKLVYLLEDKKGYILAPTKIYCDQIVEHIKLNYSNYDLKISHIAEQLHLSPQYMSKIFKAEMGESIVSYLISYRMGVARELIIHGATVTEAALSSGYIDLSNFSKTYKKHFGTAPSETI